MTPEEFLAEVTGSDICPPGFKEDYAYFLAHQKAVLEILRAFHGICERNGINYHVTYGSLLGLIRDGGLIPWDYDIDVFVPISQKGELLEALRRELPETYRVQCREWDENCRHYNMRIYPQGEPVEVLHMDVFYYCGAPEDKGERDLFNKGLRRCAMVRYGKKVNIRKQARGRLRKVLKYAASKAALAFVSMKGTDRTYDELVSRYPLDTCRSIVSAGLFASWYCFPAAMMTETELRGSRDGEFRVPADTEGYLKLVYGDYRRYPALEDRIREVTAACGKFRFYEQEKGQADMETEHL